MVSCQKGPSRHVDAWQIGPIWQDTLNILCLREFEKSVWYVSLERPQYAFWSDEWSDTQHNKHQMLVLTILSPFTNIDYLNHHREFKHGQIIAST